MSSTATLVAGTTDRLQRPARAPHPLARFGLLSELCRPGDVFANITPNWFASVMGTGIVAIAAAGLPAQFRGLHTFAVTVWAAAALLLLVLTAATVLHWVHHPATARSHASHPVMVHFYGAPPMALMTVGAGTLLLGKDILGLRAAVDLDWALWTLGTLLGLAAAVTVPYVLHNRHNLRRQDAFGGWLMSIVPPMVSASTGALLIPHAPAGPARVTMLLACYAMFAASLLASAWVTVQVWRRLSEPHPFAPALVPTVWIVLGPLGQSITAVNLLGTAAHEALPLREASAFHAFGLWYGAPAWALALAWVILAVRLTMRSARTALPFALTWWSFVFPLGTWVTGTTALALHTGSEPLRILAVVLYFVLVAVWMVVALRTADGSVKGRLFLGGDALPALVTGCSVPA
jgi:C4-dicarboxylate transporter/malic acid transport protein